MNIHDEVKTAIVRCETAKNLLSKTVRFMEEFDWNSPITEIKWCSICEKLQHDSDILIAVVKHIFPEATNVYKHNSSDYVNFTLYGVECQLPCSVLYTR